MLDVLEVETDEGMLGWDELVIESDARTVEAAVQEFADMLVGPGPARIDDL
nr:hypothetical protein [Massilia sp. 9096]